MPITYTDPHQEEEVSLIIDDLIQNSSEDLRNNNIEAIYNRIFSSEVGKKMQGDRLGKLSEVLLDMYPEMLSHMNELPVGMFYGSGLEEITLPTNITKLGMGVFALSNLKVINYEGTRHQWDMLIQNSAGWDLFSPNGQCVQDKVVVNCSDAQNIYGLNECLDESMTKKELIFKNNILKYLSEQGFPKFADYMRLYHFNFVTSEEAGQRFVAAMIPNQGVILINPKVDAEALSMLLRHEAAHQIFMHNEHMLAKLKKLGINTPSQLAHELANIAGDYDISNHIYDADDKYIAKHIRIEGELEDFAGLVTELDFPEHPEYVDMDFDQLWDVFVKNYDKDALDAEAQKRMNPDDGDGSEMSPEFVAGWNELVDAYERGDITKEQIKKWYDDHNK